MLPGHIAGHYMRDEIEIDLVRLARTAGARLILDRSVGIDRAAKTVTTASGRMIGYDILSLDIGVTAPIPDIPGFEHGHSVRPLAGFADAFARLRAETMLGESVDVTVIGGGLGGVELSFAILHALRKCGATARVRLLDRGSVLGDQPGGVRAALMRELTAQGIEVREQAAVTAVGPRSVTVGDQVLPSRFTLFATGAAPQEWLAGTGLDLHKGYITVAETLQTVSDACIFAAGDCAHMSFAPRPKAGVYAVRQAPILADNLRALMTGGERRSYAPQTDYLKLVSLGDMRALARRRPFRLTGKTMWHWKDRIDHAFMDKFAPRLFPPEPDDMLCAGCGSKVGRRVLQSQLSAAPDDAARLGTERVITTDHLRAVTPDPGLMARIAAIHALGDIWAMGAAPETALAQVILAEAEPVIQARQLAEIMTAARAIFAAAGAEIIGGHTSQGTEMTIGFTVTGKLSGAPIGLTGARPGDALILTKPLGTGVLLAAEMRRLADGRDIAALWASMVRSQGDAAKLLAKAHAMTDVTGFGLAGHLANICEASGTGAEIGLAALPLYSGSEELVARGLRSSLWAENFADIPVTGPQGPRFDLLFDPQTCGGLLAAVAPGDADRIVAALRDLGYPAALIGRLTPGPGLTAH